MKILIPAILVIALAAGALARVLTSEGAAPAVAPAPATGGSIASEAPKKTPDVAPPTDPVETVTPVLSVAPGSLEAQLAAAIDQLPPLEVAREESIEGMVVDEPAGTPAAGIEVTITPVGFEIAGHADARENLQIGNFEKYIVDRVAQYRFHELGKRSMVTDATGRFRFGDLPWARYRIVAKDPTGAGEMKVLVNEVERDFCDPSNSIVIRRMRKFRVAFEVRLPDGSSPPSATIEAAGEEFAWTPKDREFSVAGGQHQFKILEDGKTRARKRAGIYSDRLDLPVVLELTAKSGISLSVAYPDDQPPEQVRAWSAVLPPGVFPDEKWLLRHGNEHHLYGRNMRKTSEVEDSSLQQDLAPLPAGTYAVAIGRTDGAVDQIATVTVPVDELVPLTMELPPVEADAVIEVWVYGPDGGVINDVSLSLQQMSGMMGSSVEAATLPRPDGSYWLRPPASVFEILSGEMAGTITLHVRANGYPSREIPLTTAFVEVQFAEPATLFFEIGGGEGHENLQFEIVDAEGSRVGSWDSDDLERGIGPVDSGDVMVAISGGNNRWEASPLIEPFWITLRPGENRIPVTLDATYSLTVDVTEVKKGEQMMLFRLDGVVFPDRFSNPQMAEPDGTSFHFANLLPGRYSVLLGSQMSMDFSGMEIAVNRDARVSYAGIELTAVMIRLSELASAEIPFRDGDKLIGVEGKEFSGIADIAMVFEGNVGSVKFIVIRAGQQIEVETTTQQLQELMMGGAQMLPVARD